MSKALKIFLNFLIIFSLLVSCYCVFASDINMNLEPEQTQSSDNSTGDENTGENVDTTNNLEEQTSTQNSSYTEPTNVGSIAEEGLGFSNILSILLITVGVILILLAIAIIIRLK